LSASAGKFRPLSVAGSDEELQSVRKTTEDTLAEVEGIATGLAKTSGSRTARPSTKMRRTHMELRTMANDRLKARRQISEAYQHVAQEISSAGGG